MLEDGTNPDGEIGPGTIDPPTEEEGASRLRSGDDEALDPGTIDPPNNN